MNQLGDSPNDLLVLTRSALLDALEALGDQREAVVVIGAQAVYLQTGGIDVALAETTKDSDVALDPRLLNDHPHLEEAMKSAGFVPSINPGSWVSPNGVPVDVMVPDKLSNGGRRGARIPPHDKRAARTARGLEAAVVDHEEVEITSLDPDVPRRTTAKVASAAALLVAKLHKITERLDAPSRLENKDAHDVYRILRAKGTLELRDAILRLLDDELSREVTGEALGYLVRHFAAGAEAVGSAMAGRAEEGVGDPEQVAVATAFLSQDLVVAVIQAGHHIDGAPAL